LCELYSTILVYLLALPFYAALITGKRGRKVSLVISIGLVSLVGALFVTGQLSQSNLHLGLGNQSLLSSFVGVVIFTLIAVGGTISAGVLLGGYQKSIESQNIQTYEIINERALLEGEIQQRADELQRRLVQIRTAAEINRAISQMLDIDQLLPEVCKLVSQRFGLYYVGIFLIEESNSLWVESQPTIGTDIPPRKICRFFLGS
jgi:hypothetical protein